MPNNRFYNLGFTLVETIIVIAIAAILMALALPSFTETIRSNRLATTSNNLLAALNLARSEAVKRGIDVVVRKVPNGNWEDGWQVFTDVEWQNATPAAGNKNVFNDDGDSTLCEKGEDCILKVFPGLPVGYSLRGNNNLVDFIRYTPSGISNYIADEQAGTGNDYYVLCDNTDGDDNADSKNSRLIVVNTVGRPRLGMDTNTPKDGVPNNSAGNNVTDCVP
jgi:type IV fimbrial biogenesis protein FimT